MLPGTAHVRTCSDTCADFARVPISTGTIMNFIQIFSKSDSDARALRAAGVAFVIRRMLYCDSRISTTGLPNRRRPRGPPNGYNLSSLPCCGAKMEMRLCPLLRTSLCIFYLVTHFTVILRVSLSVCMCVRACVCVCARVCCIEFPGAGRAWYPMQARQRDSACKLHAVPVQPIVSFCAGTAHSIILCRYSP